MKIQFYNLNEVYLTEINFFVFTLVINIPHFLFDRKVMKGGRKQLLRKVKKETSLKN